MGGKGADLSNAEWLVMSALWEHKRATATDIQGIVRSDQNWAYSTVKTMLDRLVDKGFVKARRVGNVYEYSPKVKRPAAVNRAVNGVAERLFGGAVAPFIQCLIEGNKLTPREAAELRDMLDAYAEDEGDTK